MTYSKAPLTHRAASLETAACLWEAVLEMESWPLEGILPQDRTEKETRAAQIKAARSAMGSSHLRLTVIGWTDAVDAAWIDADGCEDLGRGGQYGAPFDWEFVPGWIAANIDWSDANNPRYAPSAHTAPDAGKGFTRTEHNGDGWYAHAHRFRDDMRASFGPAEHEIQVLGIASAWVREGE